jgi:L-fucose isomerase
MRVETVDMSEFIGRINAEIYDKSEFVRALKWVKENCFEGKDWNPFEKQRSRSQKDEDWETCIKMALIARDLMVGNPALREAGYVEQSRGHNAIVAGFQGQRQWTDHFPNGDFLEAILCSSFDWNGTREPFVVATENDSLNGASMLLGHLLTGAPQMFSDVRTYWSPKAVERVTGKKVTNAGSGGFLHLINSGPSPLDWSGEANGAVLPWWEMNANNTQARVFPRRRMVNRLHHQRWNRVHDVSDQSRQESRSRTSNCGGRDDLSRRGNRTNSRRTN